jgi:hypothetical protein
MIVLEIVRAPGTAADPGPGSGRGPGLESAAGSAREVFLHRNGDRPTAGLRGAAQIGTDSPARALPSVTRLASAGRAALGLRVRTQERAFHVDLIHSLACCLVRSGRAERPPMRGPCIGSSDTPRARLLRTRGVADRDHAAERM